MGLTTIGMSGKKERQRRNAARAYKNNSKRKLIMEMVKVFSPNNSSGGLRIYI
jgi:hypothetical protein